MTAAETTWTVNTIQSAMRARGSHWWNPDTMKTFGTKPASPVYQGPGGVFFVTRDKQYDGSYGHTVRQYRPESADIETVGDLAGYSLKQAKTKAKREAAQHHPISAVAEHAERFRPVTVLEDFTDVCRRHGDPNATPADCRRLMAKAAAHHKYMEAQCNGEWPYAKWNGEDGHPRPVEQCRAEARKLAKRVGASGVVFSGDPRGCTLKLTFSDGFTNDFGREGYCVPTGDDD